MGTGTTTNHQCAPNMQMVYLVRNGVATLDYDIYCTSVTTQQGAAGSSAEFTVPAWKWDHEREWLYNREVIVYMGEHGAKTVNSRPVFQGFIQSDSANLDAGDNSVGFTAISVVPLLTKVPVGLGENTLHKTYLVHNPRFGNAFSTEQKWTPSTILQHIFNNLPSYWKAYVKLGNIHVLNDFAEAAWEDQEFKSEHVLDAISKLIAGFGDVTFKERFMGLTAPHVYLDFYRINADGTTRTYVNIPRLCNDIRVSGANVEAVSQTVSQADVATRVVGTGQKYKIVVECSTVDPDPRRRLIRDWENYTITCQFTDRDGNTKPITLTAEEWIKRDSGYGKDGDDRFTLKPNAVWRANGQPVTLTSTSHMGQFCEPVLRRYMLPKCLRQFKKDEELPLYLYPAKEDLAQNGNDLLKTKYMYSKDIETDKAKRVPITVAKNFVQHIVDASAEQRGYDLINDGRLSMDWGYYPCGGAYGEYSYGYGRQGLEFFELYNFHEIKVFGVKTADRLPVSGVDEQLNYNYIMLNEPALNVIGEEQPCIGDPNVKAFAEADIFLTFAIMYNDSMMYDTSQPSLGDADPEMIGHDGLVLSFANDSFQWNQIGNLTPGPKLKNGVQLYFPIIDPDTGTAVTFSKASWYDPNAGAFCTYDTEIQGAFQSRNDYDRLRFFCEQILRERSKLQRDYSYTLAYCTQAYDLGQLVTPLNQANHRYDNYAINRIRYSLDSGNPQTEISCSNVRPTSNVEFNDVL